MLFIDAHLAQWRWREVAVDGGSAAGGLAAAEPALRSRSGDDCADMPTPGQTAPPHESIKDNMGWSGWEEFRNLTPNDKTNLQEQK
jgi:hypothetical protein